MPSREEIVAAWTVLVSTNEDGEFKLSRNAKGEVKLTLATYMDISLAHVILTMLEEQTEERRLVKNVNC